MVARIINFVRLGNSTWKNRLQIAASLSTDYSYSLFWTLQLHWEAWVRFIVVSIIAVCIYAAYGQYHAASLDCTDSTLYHTMPAEDSQ